MFTAAYSAFHQQYPNITIVPREGVVRDLQRLISQGIWILDFNIDRYGPN